MPGLGGCSGCRADTWATQGGETVFPLEGEHGLDRLPTIDYRSCQQGFKVGRLAICRRPLLPSAPAAERPCAVQYKPRQGDALLFWSMHPNGTFDKHALHGGCPVVSVRPPACACISGLVAVRSKQLRLQGTKFVATKWIRDKG